ncbi:MAG: tetratricopeptide repeat protein, partial [Verrucomicrobiota bacterium]
MNPDPEARLTMESVVVELSLLGEYDAPPLPVERDLLERWDLHTNIGVILCQELTRSSEDYVRAEAHFRAAEKLAADIKGEESTLLATALNNLAVVLKLQGKHDEVKPLAERAIAIGEKILDAEYSDVATRLDKVGDLLKALGKYDEAKPLYERALAKREETLDAEDPSIAVTLDSLGLLLNAQGNGDEAQQRYERAFVITEKAFGTEHPRLAAHLINLAALFEAQERYDKAKPLYEQAVAIGEKTLGAEHPNVATWLTNVAGVSIAQGKYDEAEPLFARAIAIGEMAFGGSEHPEIGTWLNTFAELLKAQGKYDDVKLPPHEPAVEIGEETLDVEHASLASLTSLAALLIAQGKDDEANRLNERALAIKQEAIAAGYSSFAGGSTVSLLRSRFESLASCDQTKPFYHRAIS